MPRGVKLLTNTVGAKLNSSPSQMSAMNSLFVSLILMIYVAQNWQAVQTNKCVIPYPACKLECFWERFSPPQLYNYRKLGSFSS